MKGIVILSSALFMLGGGSASAISTYSSWDGQQYRFPFGCPAVTTFGQVITAPANTHWLNRFSFWLAHDDANPIGWGQLRVRGHVYAWDGSKATGHSLYDSPRRTLAYKDASFHKETFSPVALPVTPGKQYVIFLAVAEDFFQCADTLDVGLKWGTVTDTTYAGGSEVYQNSEDEPARWTTWPWTVDISRHVKFDSVFQAEFRF